MQTLLESLTYRVIGPAIKKKWFSEPIVPFRRYLGVYEEAFEMGVALGYAHRDKLPWLAQLFSDKGREQELVNALSELVQQRLSELPSANSLFTLGMFAEEDRIKADFRARSIPGTGAFSLSEDDIEGMVNKLDIPVAVAFGNLQTVMSVGIGLGGAFPNKAEEFWTYQYERPITEYRILKLRAAGLNLPATMPKSISLTQYGEQIRLVVDAFISKNRPDLVAQLNSARR
ncbi:MAG TPA: hypothetical protein VFC37_06315 [Terracidiphilus sp.]|nr:hypothetical protein [Terracidiphilus sp.]